MEKSKKKLSLDAFKAKVESENMNERVNGLVVADANKLVGGLMDACHTGGSSTCLYPSGYAACVC